MADHPDISLRLNEPNWPSSTLLGGRPIVLLVDADERQRTLMRTTLASLDLEVDEAASLSAAAARIKLRLPDAVVLGANLPSGDPLAFCRRLAADPRSRGLRIVAVGTGGPLRRRALCDAGAATFLDSPSGPLQLVEAVERLVYGRAELRVGAAPGPAPEDQLLGYARDLRRLLELERGQRLLLRQAYRQPVDALATALASKDTGTRAHSQRVEQYATRLLATIDPARAGDPALESGFLLHDIGKIGIPDRILLKAGPLTPEEQRLMRTHTILGEQMVAEIPLLGEAGLGVVRSHHERWDGGGYPDRLGGLEIPIGARVFAVVDALDAMTTDRPYRRPSSWPEAVTEIALQAGRQFDPEIVEAFLDVQQDLRGIYHDLAAA